MEKSFISNSIEAQKQPEGGRGIELYEEVLGFKREDLNNKVILDLGAGPELKLAKELHEQHINAQVVELSPDFIQKSYRKTALKHKDADTHVVAGLGQNLPFKTEGFDYVLMLHVLDHLPHTEYGNEKVSEEVRNMLPDVFLEIARVLKPNGTAYIGPARRLTESTLKANPDFIEALRKLHVSISFEDFSTKNYTQQSVYDDHTGMRVGTIGYKRIKMTKES